MPDYRNPGASWTTTVTGGTTGQAAQWTVALLNFDTGAVVITATNTGVSEYDSPSGNYRKTFTLPLTPAVYQAEWQKAGVKYLDDNLVQVGGSQPITPGSASSYTSISALRQVLAPDGSTDVTLGTAASLSDAELQEAIDEAAAEINARLAGRYSVPLTAPAPVIVEKINRDLAAYMATLVYRRNIPLPAEDPIRLRYARALDLLKGIGSGVIELTTDTGALGQSSEAYVVNTIGYEGDLFALEDFSLVQGPIRYGTMPGGPFDGEGF